MKYIFIDTNIYIYCALITKGNYTTKTIDSLNREINTNNTKLLMPEIIKLEFEKKAKNIFENEVSNDIKKIKKKIQEISFPEYLGEEKSKIEKNIDDLLEKRRKNLKRVSENIIKDIGENKNTIILELTNDIFFKSYKRALKGEKPYTGKICSQCGNMENVINADCIIIESLLEYFKNQDLNEDDELIFCSNNTKDFATFNSETNKHELHKDIEEQLKLKVKYYNNLPDLLKQEFKTEIDTIEVKEIKNLEKEALIAHEISNFGIPADIPGCQYLKETIALVLEDNEYMYSLRSAYRKIAEKYKTSHMRIWASIVRAIEYGLEKRNNPNIEKDIWNCLKNNNAERPTPTEFIMNIVQRIENANNI